MLMRARCLDRASLLSCIVRIADHHAPINMVSDCVLAMLVRDNGDDAAILFVVSDAGPSLPSFVADFVGWAIERERCRTL